MFGLFPHCVRVCDARMMCGCDARVCVRSRVCAWVRGCARVCVCAYVCMRTRGKSRPPPPKKFEVLTLRMSIYTLFGRSMRQFHHIGSESQSPAEAAVCLGQNTVQKPEALLGEWLLGHDMWSGTARSFDICPAWTPPRCLPGHSGCRKTRQGQRAQNTFLLASAGYAYSLLCAGWSK